MGTHQPTDPPMEPSPDSTRWFESGPDAITQDIDAAVLIVKIGMASNALIAQMHAAKDAGQRRGSAAIRERDIISSFLTTAALTYEAVGLARSGLAVLRPLALSAGASRQLLDRMGQLCAGKHPSSALLDRARNRLGFHWDGELIKPSVQDFGTNEMIVWLESDDDFSPVHTLARAVLIHALFPESTIPLESDAKKAIDEAMAGVSDAIDLIVEFFTASVYGFMRDHCAVPKTRKRGLFAQAIHLTKRLLMRARRWWAWAWTRRRR